jgi:1-acyl-sn-glycerol-3-phosphate acyltransferase
MNAHWENPGIIRVIRQFRRAATTMLLKGLLNTLCDIDNHEFTEALSKTGPLIVVINHINFLEVPILVTHSYPVCCTGLVKSETWKNPFFSFLLNTYQAIPINREGSYRETFRQVRRAMDNGFYVVIAPEGTRSGDGVLRKGKAGLIQLAIDTNSAILPVVHYGGQQIWKNIKHFRRTPFQFRAGRPFRIKYEKRPGREEREKIMDEIMGQIARLLPPEMRGAYSEQAEQECIRLDFIGQVC